MPGRAKKRSSTPPLFRLLRIRWPSNCLSQTRERSFQMCRITNHSIANSLRAPPLTSASSSAICEPCFCPVESCTFLKAVNIYSLSLRGRHTRARCKSLRMLAAATLRSPPMQLINPPRRHHFRAHRSLLSCVHLGLARMDDEFFGENNVCSV